MTAKGVKPKSALTMRLLKVTGIPDPQEAVKARVCALVRQSGRKSPPFSPESIFRFCGIRRIEHSNLAVDGELARDGDGYVIRLNASSPPRRQRFTCAHEIAHTFFLENKEERLLAQRAPRSGDAEEERLCDIAAAYILMPYPYFEWKVSDYGPSASALLALADEFETSLHATLRRLCDAGIWKVLVAVWQKRGSQVKRTWFMKAKEVRGQITDWVPKEGGPIFQCFEKGYAVGREGMLSSQVPVDYFVECIRVGRDVLSVAILEKEPECLIGRFRHKNYARRQQQPVCWTFAAP